MNEKSMRSVDYEYRSNATSASIGTISGYCMLFNTPSVDMGFVEYVEPTALNDVDLSNVVALFNHDYANILGRVSAGNLSLKVDDKGLFFALDVPDTTLGHDVYTNIKLGILKGMSFSFVVADDEWQLENGQNVRTITKFESVDEISITAIPAYPDTSVVVTRNLDNMNNLNVKQKVIEYLNGKEI